VAVEAQVPQDQTVQAVPLVVRVVLERHLQLLVHQLLTAAAAVVVALVRAAQVAQAEAEVVMVVRVVLALRVLQTQVAAVAAVAVSQEVVVLVALVSLLSLHHKRRHPQLDHRQSQLLVAEQSTRSLHLEQSPFKDKA
jgi:hypothetical protein